MRHNGREVGDSVRKDVENNDKEREKGAEEEGKDAKNAKEGGGRGKKMRRRKKKENSFHRQYLTFLYNLLSVDRNEYELT